MVGFVTESSLTPLTTNKPNAILKIVITATNLSKNYTGAPVLVDITCKIGNNRKIGIVGRNGCGKTTLLKILNGIETADKGSLTFENEKLGYLPQELEFDKELVGECLECALENNWEGYKIDVLLEELQFTNYDPYQTVESLSEGQKMKLKLVETLLKDPTVLFIDEPTNHLDIEGIMWFEEYVKALKKTVVMISHDRSFLNHTVDEIWEIENGKKRKFVGDYDNYKTEKLQLINKMDAEYVLFLKKKNQLETLLANVHKIKDGKKRGKAVSSAKKRIEREVEGNKKEKYETKLMKKVEFDTGIHASKLMIKFDDVSKSYGDNQIFNDLSFEIRGKEKVWLYGPNGAGKSTIVKIIMGDEQAISGLSKVGDNIKVGYFAQKQTHLDYDQDLFEHFIASTGCPYYVAYKYLDNFLFSKDDIKKRVRNLSPGERARFAFAIFAYKDYDMLILDEPSNHLDIEAKEVIEESLSKFKGTLLLISHDRYFVERVGIDKVLNLKDGILNSYA